MSQQHTVTAAFSNLGPFLAALEELRRRNITRFWVYTPVELSEHEHLMPRQGSPVQWFSLTAGIVGCILGFALAIGSALLYRIAVGGKPPVAWLTYCVVGFELAILTSALVTFAMTLLLSRLYPRETPDRYWAGFSVDEFGLTVPGGQADIASLVELFTSLGAREIRET